MALYHPPEWPNQVWCQAAQVLLSWKTVSLLPIELIFGKGIAQPFTVIDSLSFPKRGQKRKFLGGVSQHIMVGICLLRSEMSTVPSISPLKGDKELPTPP